jgi:UPF0716 family protein affecting phage T7 exclusion
MIDEVVVAIAAVVLLLPQMWTVFIIALQFIIWRRDAAYAGPRRRNLSRELRQRTACLGVCACSLVQAADQVPRPDVVQPMPWPLAGAGPAWRQPSRLMAAHRGRRRA